MVVDKGEKIGVVLQLIKSDGVSVEENATVTYRIFDSTGVVEKVSVQSASFNTLTRSYVGTIDPSILWANQEGGAYLIVWSVSGTGDDFNDTYTEDLQISDFGEVLNAIKDIEYGDWQRVGTQMIFRKAGGAVVARFNLFKFDGSPATESDYEVAKREKV